MRRRIFDILIGIYFLLFCNLHTVNAQAVDTAKFKVVTPGPQYSRSAFHNFLWGKHYRQEWNTPVAVPLFYLDTAAGGLTPYEAGGGRQSKTLRLRNKEGKEYVLRSIDKTFGKALAPIFQGTFVEKIFNDQVSIAHPYAALTVAPMAEAAGILHTWPKVVYVPHQPALDSFDKEFGNDLYLYEQRPDENWDEAPHFGGSKDIISTEDLLQNLLESNLNEVDQPAYIRARLFDIFVGDWGRHEDQWRWAAFDEGGRIVYRPIPRDRDQTYTKFDGFLVKLLKSAAGIGHLQTFDATIKDINTYNFPARNLDRLMANKMTGADWKLAAVSLQKLLTDDIIESAVKTLPSEVYPLSGAEIASKLKRRRNDIISYAEAYYSFLAKEVDVKGSKGAELYELSADASGDAALMVYGVDNRDTNTKRIIYSRIFTPAETKEIRVYGIGGKDRYNVSGETKIKVRIIGGPEGDQYSSSGKSVHVYDSKSQQINGGENFKQHLSNDTSIHSYRYDAFKYSDKGISPTIFFNRDDRIFVGLGYKMLNQKWRREPFANKHAFWARYSINQRAFHIGYDGVVNKITGNWNLLLAADYDWERWTNFFGLGNESVRTVKDRDFYRVRSLSANASLGFENVINQNISFILSPFYNSFDIKTDDDRFLMKNFLQGRAKDVLENKHFGGAQATIRIKKLNDNIWPTKGINFSATTAYTANLKEDKSFNSYAGLVNLYLPLSRHFVFSTQNGGATVTGEPEFYQLPNIGGRTLKGYTRERFWGETVFHNNNSLQYIFNVTGKLFNGKAGLEAFYDQGKVWLKGQKSNTWHTGYGGGIVLSPFNKLYLAVLYGVSNDKVFRGNVNIDVKKSF